MPALRTLGLLDRVSTAGQALLDLFYPPRCPGCGCLGVAFCADCQGRVERIALPVCPRCGRPAADDRLCEACQRTPSSLDGIAAATVFADPIRQAIHSLKYQGNRSLARPLGRYMVETWDGILPPADLIVPVPLHSRRLAERGYNQSALLARVLGSGVEVRVEEGLLIRRRATLPQVGLDWRQRQPNVAGAFVCRDHIGGQKVVLVDDVCTTGATLEACAEALRAAGAASVWGLTLARARWELGTPPPDAAPDLRLVR